MPVIYVAVMVLMIDLFLKYLVLSKMQLHQSIPVIENIFHITYLYNYGAAFGILAGKTWFFILVTLAMLAGMAFFYKRILGESLWVQTALGLLTGGALGNLIDRLRFGKVVDFLDFRFWPVFNLADVAIVTGVGLLIFELFRRPELKAEQKER